VQTLLKLKAPYGRGKDARATQSSFLIGKAFVETGDRLSPSHSQKNGKRLRYYISHRLGKRGGEAGITGWRLPAQPFEDQIVAAGSEYLQANVVSKILINPPIEIIQSVTKIIKNIYSNPENIAALIERVDIAPGTVRIALNPSALTMALYLKGNKFNDDALTFSLPFQTRKRGVETKLIIGHVAPDKDKTLIRNLATAHKWLQMIKTGKTLATICDEFQTTRRRIQQMLRFTFSSPEIVQMIVEGRQPIGLTSAWIERTSLPQDWQDQRELIASL
jgi:hypothetical protein